MKQQKDNNPLYTTLFGAFILLATAIFILVLVNGTKKEAEVVIGQDTVEITGQFGTTFALQDLEAVDLRDHMPKIGPKVNGAGLGSIRKGEYELEGYGRSRLYLHAETGPFIFLKVGGKYIYINFSSEEKTRAVYEELRTILAK